MLIDDIQMIRTVVCIFAIERIAHSLADLDVAFN